MSRLAAIRMPRKVSMPQWNGRSVRFRLLAIALLPTLVILPLLLGIAAVRWNERFDATLISKVNGDLTIAHQYLAHLLERTGNHVQALGLRSEEHTSELQSLMRISYAVFCLKKKKLNSKPLTLMNTPTIHTRET